MLLRQVRFLADTARKGDADADNALTSGASKVAAEIPTILRQSPRKSPDVAVERAMGALLKNRMQTESQLRYHAYLTTDYWKQVTDAVKARAGYRCQVCNSPHDLQAHHRSYAHRGAELEHLDDLTCLCRRCHEVFHGKGPAQVAEKQKEDPWADTVLVTAQNCKQLRCTKEPWHWMLKQGINPRRKGWAQRAVGRSVPRKWMRGA